MPLIEISKLLSHKYNKKLNLIQLAYHDDDKNKNNFKIVSIFRRLAHYGAKFGDYKCLINIVSYIKEHHFLYRNSLKNHHRFLLKQEEWRLKRNKENQEIDSFDSESILNPNYRLCLNLLGNPNIVSDLIRGLAKYREFDMASDIWDHYTHIMQQQHQLQQPKQSKCWFTIRNFDTNTVYPCVAMLRICGILINNTKYVCSNIVYYIYIYIDSVLLYL